MSEKRRKGRGYDEVRNYILTKIRNRECQFDSSVRISSDEIAKEIGISRQAVCEHIRAMILQGIIQRHRRCYFSRRIEEEMDIPVSVTIRQD